jgi:integrase
MVKRRTFGRVRQLPSGRWQARYPTSRGLIAAPNTFPTRKLADQYLAQVQTDQLQGTWIDPASGRITLREYADISLTNRTLAPTTTYKYRGLLDRYLLPAFGHMELGQVTPVAVRSWNAALAGKHPDTAAQAYRLLASIFNNAVEDDLLAKSPCRVKNAGSHRNPERAIATIEEIATAVNVTDERYRLSIVLAAWCHLRPQEILGLQRRHIDLRRTTVRIDQTMTNCGGPMVPGPPKTEAGRREIHIPEHVLPYLTAHLDMWVDLAPEGWLFPGPKGATIHIRTLQRHWDKARGAIGRPDLRLYDMRHTGLTLSAAGGASLKEIMRRGGHSSPAAALNYQHATDGRDKLIATGLAAVARASELSDPGSKGHAGGMDTESALGPEVDLPTESVLDRGERRPTFEPPPDFDRGESPGQSGAVAELIGQQATDFLADAFLFDTAATEQPQRDSNPCRHLERVVSLASRRWGRAEVSRRNPPVLGGKDSNPQ